MDLCMTHRFEETHDCTPVKAEEVYEKIKKSNKLFDWGSNYTIKKKK